MAQPPVTFDTTIEDIEPLDITGLQTAAPKAKAFGRESDITDVLAGTAGAGLGAFLGADKPLTHKDLKEMRLQMAADREASEIRKAVEAANAAAQKSKFGSGVENWVPTQYNEEVSRSVLNQGPSSQPNAAQLAAQAEANIAKSKTLAPHQVPAQPGSLIHVPLTVGGGSKVLPAPAPAPAPMALPPAKAAPINFGSTKGRVLNTAGGAVMGVQANDALQRAQQGDYVGSTLGGLSSAGAGAATFSKNPKVKAIGTGVSAGAGALQQLYDYLRNKPAEEPKQHAEGGLVPGYSGAKGSFVKKVVGAAEGALNNFVARPTQEVKFSEAIAPHEGKYLGAHMSDRFGTHGTRMGGTGFPNFQNVSPKHQAENVVWMNDSELAARKLIENRTFNGQPMIHTNYIGSPAQHASNKTVHADVLDNFYKNLAAGKLTDEQIAKINAGIAARSRDTGTVKKTPFSQNFDIRDRFAAQEIGGNTMDSRRALSDMLGTGVGAGGTKNVAVPTYQDILKSHADPLTMNAPTSSMGTRLFEIFDEPTKFSEEFHPDYRWVVHGKDQNVQFPAVPQSVGARDFYKEFKQRFPDMEPHGNAWFAYPKKPQLITEDYIRNAQDLGFAEGGLAHC